MKRWLSTPSQIKCGRHITSSLVQVRVTDGFPDAASRHPHLYNPIVDPLPPRVNVCASLVASWGSMLFVFCLSGSHRCTRRRGRLVCALRRVVGARDVVSGAHFYELCSSLCACLAEFVFPTAPARFDFCVVLCVCVCVVCVVCMCVLSSRLFALLLPGGRKGKENTRDTSLTPPGPLESQ